MPRKTSSQWDFGELFPAEALRRVFSVSELTGRIRGLLEQQVGEVWVGGEVSNLRVQSSGHSYFTLKDAGAQLSCVLFRGTPAADRAALRDGQRVVLQGEVSVYEPRGQYQLIVRSVEVQGVGALQAAFERLKSKLQAEGLFEAERKRPLPRYPRRLGLVTSATGAAIRDVCHVLERRYAGIEVVLVPCRVQGKGAEEEIAAAIGLLNAWSSRHPAEGVEVILVTRGGGSLEDLWAFNEEVVARAIAASAAPVISAVGHEIDFTIADFVADLRAATPSAAAEVLTAGYVEARDRLAGQARRMGRLMAGTTGRARAAAESWAGRLRRAHPRRRLNERWQLLDDLVTELAVRWRALLERQGQRVRLAVLGLAAVRVGQRVTALRDRLAERRGGLRRAGQEGLRARREALDRLVLRLGLLSPERVLARGYSITTDEVSGRVMRSAAEALPGQRLRTRLASGEVTSVVAPLKAGGDAPARGQSNP